MLPRKSSVATVDYPIHSLVLPQGFSVTRRHSAAPFSLTRAPTTDTKYSTLGASHLSKTSSSQEPRPIKLEDIGYERAFFARMGRKLSAFLPKGAPAEHQESPVLKIKMRKEVHVITEEAAKDVGMGDRGNEGPLLYKPPYLWKSPNEERIHGSHIHKSGVSLRPATAPGGSAGGHSRRKPVPLSPVDIEYHTTTRIEQSYPKYSEQPRFQTLPPTRPYSAVPDGPMVPKRSQPHLGYENTPTKQTNVVYAINRTSSQVPPPVPPKPTQYMPHSQASPLPNSTSTVVVPIRPAQMRSLWTAWKSLFGGRVGKGRRSYSKKGAIFFARKVSLKRKKGNTTHSPYQPCSYSTRAVAPPPAHTPRDYRHELNAVSRRFSVKHSRRLSRKQTSGLPSFLSIDSSDSLT